jgi:hypothetical protein
MSRLRAPRLALALSVLALLLGLASALHQHAHASGSSLFGSKTPAGNPGRDSDLGRPCSICLTKAGTGLWLPAATGGTECAVLPAALPRPQAPETWLLRSRAPLSPRAPPLGV